MCTFSTKSLIDLQSSSLMKYVLRFFLKNMVLRERWYYCNHYFQEELFQILQGGSTSFTLNHIIYNKQKQVEFNGPFKTRQFRLGGRMGVPFVEFLKCFRTYSACKIVVVPLLNNSLASSSKGWLWQNGGMNFGITKSLTTCWIVASSNCIEISIPCKININMLMG
jgi:hypothetical protein